MKIALHLQAAVTQQAGVGRYTKELAKHLLDLLDDHTQLRLDYFDFRRNAQIPPELHEHPSLHPIRYMPGALAQKTWNYFGFPPYDVLHGKADLYHFPNFLAPPCKTGKRIVTIHDLSFMRFPEYTEAKNLRFLTKGIHRTAQQADAIMTISKFSAQEVINLLHVPEQRVFTTHLGVSPSFIKPSADYMDAFRARHNISRPYLLTVGTVEPRKNLPFLISLFEKMKDYDGDLIIAGGLGWRYEPILQQMQASPRAKQIRRIGYMPEADLTALYAGADAFVLPSHYEGFGLPPLESMACQTPVVTSNGGSLPEVVQDGAIVLDHFDPDAWEQTLYRILSDRTEREALIQRGLQVAGQYSWEQTAKQTLAVYRKVLS